MRVYRVERAGVGPYKHPMGTWKIGIDGWADSRRPMPSSDGLPYEDVENHLFGFRSKKQLQKWFRKKDRKALVKSRFKCRIYKVPKEHVHFGQCQVVFNSKRATKLKETIPLA